MINRFRRLTGDLKRLGLKGFLKRNGWKVLLSIFIYYLIRDAILYILLPILVARVL